MTRKSRKIGRLPPAQPDSDLEKGVVTVVVLMALVLGSIVLGSLIELAHLFW